MCLRCGTNRSTSERGYCASCVFAIRAEIEDGLVRLGEYLQRWAAYSDWCAKRGFAA
jgi:hypothetical protein